MAQHRAPLTLGVIVQLSNLLEQNGITNSALAKLLNKYLPPKKQIKDNHPGQIKLNRWLNPTSNAWTEPRGEIVLAMQKVVKDLSE